MINLLKKLLWGDVVYDELVEGVYAHQYKDEAIRSKIKDKYTKVHTPKITPLTDPLKFDPLNPPLGWSYDPYYECWVETK